MNLHSVVREASGPASVRSQDTALMRGLREGREEARAELVRSFGAHMFAVARRLTRREEDATRALLEAFQLAFRSAASGVTEGDVQCWLHRIVIDVCLARLRSAAPCSDMRGLAESEPSLLPAFDDAGCHRNHVQAWRGWEELDTPTARAEVRRCIDELPEPLRIVIVLCNIEGLGTAEAAEHLCIPPALARLRLHQARQALLALLQPRFALSG